MRYRDYGRPEAIAWCERQRIGYIFDLAGNSVLLHRVDDLAEEVAIARLDTTAEKVHRYSELRSAATGWKVARRVTTRVDAGPQGVDGRFIVTDLKGPSS
ncbi:MAG: transposase [Stellaceae bacterium]